MFRNNKRNENASQFISSASRLSAFRKKFYVKKSSFSYASSSSEGKNVKMERGEYSNWPRVCRNAQNSKLEAILNVRDDRVRKVGNVVLRKNESQEDCYHKKQVVRGCPLSYVEFCDASSFFSSPIGVYKDERSNISTNKCAFFLLEKERKHAEKLKKENINRGGNSVTASSNYNGYDDDSNVIVSRRSCVETEISGEASRQQCFISLIKHYIYTCIFISKICIISLYTAYLVYKDGLRDAISVHKCIVFFLKSETVRKRTLWCLLLNCFLFTCIIFFTNVVVPAIQYIILIICDMSHMKNFSAFLHLLIDNAISPLCRYVVIYPLYIWCLFLNTLWYQEIAEHAYILFRNSPDSAEEKKNYNTNTYSNSSKNNCCFYRSNTKKNTCDYYRNSAMKRCYCCSNKNNFGSFSNANYDDAIYIVNNRKKFFATDGIELKNVFYNLNNKNHVHNNALLCFFIWLCKCCPLVYISSFKSRENISCFDFEEKKNNISPRTPVVLCYKTGKEHYNSDGGSILCNYSSYSPSYLSSVPLCVIKKKEQSVDRSKISECDCNISRHHSNEDMMHKNAARSSSVFFLRQNAQNLGELHVCKAKSAIVERNIENSTGRKREEGGAIKKNAECGCGKEVVEGELKRVSGGRRSGEKKGAAVNCCAADEKLVQRIKLQKLKKEDGAGEQEALLCIIKDYYSDAKVGASEIFADSEQHNNMKKAKENNCNRAVAFEVVRDFRDSGVSSSESERRAASSRCLCRRKGSSVVASCGCQRSRRSNVVCAAATTNGGRVLWSNTADSLVRLLFTYIWWLQTLLLRFIPAIGNSLYCISFALIVSYYSFEYNYQTYKYNTQQRLIHFEYHWIYYFGFGTPCMLFAMSCNGLLDWGALTFFFPLCILTSIRATPKEYASKFFDAQTTADSNGEAQEEEEEALNNKSSSCNNNSCCQNNQNDNLACLQRFSYNSSSHNNNDNANVACFRKAKACENSRKHNSFRNRCTCDIFTNCSRNFNASGGKTLYSNNLNNHASDCTRCTSSNHCTNAYFCNKVDGVLKNTANFNAKNNEGKCKNFVFCSKCAKDNQPPADIALKNYYNCINRWMQNYIFFFLYRMPIFLPVQLVANFAFFLIAKTLS